MKMKKEDREFWLFSLKIILALTGFALVLAGEKSGERDSRRESYSDLTESSCAAVTTVSAPRKEKATAAVTIKQYSRAADDTDDSTDPYDADSFYHPDDFYYDHYDDFYDYEDAEDYWYEHHGE
ncbi:hypothetical protein [Ruminococcus sp.]|uniref:hypothetical protein n=1 Tax=Ruminococcus sp. TaxID=41978 RepID=UPI0025F7C1B7|nr:hypothetical protein [Ruminococcus sp.]MBQ8966105.1 hypothetical protein [Ruminococcus sp.]